MVASTVVATVAASGLAAVTGVTPASASNCAPAGVAAAPDTNLDTAFSTYESQATGTTWAGADGPHSVALPDGRTGWLFQDTFFGVVSAAGSRSHATLVRNSLVMEQGGALTETLFTAGKKPGAYIPVPPPPGKKKASKAYGLWPGGTIVEGGHLFVVLAEYKFTQKTFGLTFQGDWLADFTLTNGQDPTLNSVTPLISDGIDWSGPIFLDGGNAFVYGYANGDAYVAQAPLGVIQSSWQFWNGTTWDSNDANAAPVGAAGTGYSVTKVGGAYVMVGMGASTIGFGSTVQVSFSCTATGPFSAPVDAYTAPESGLSPLKGYGQIVTYDAHAQPAVAVGSNQLEVSYDVRPVKSHKALNDVTIYRPRYVTLTFG